MRCVCADEKAVLMFGVIMSGDTREHVCVLQMRRLHDVNARFIFDDEAMFASARLCSDFAFQGGPWGNVRIVGRCCARFGEATVQQW